jgi:hypothetical protein
MNRFMTIVVFLMAARVLPAQMTLPFASPPYGKNGNLGIGVELTPTLDAMKSGALGLSMSVEMAPNRTSKYSLKWNLAYFHMDARTLFGADTLNPLYVGMPISMDMLDLIFRMRVYPTAQGINTLFFGVGIGVTVLITTITGASGPAFLGIADNTVIQPQILYEAGYKLRLFDIFYIEPSVIYKLPLPAPGIDWSVNIPLFTLLTTNNSDFLSGVEFALSVGLEF